ncbi:MAG: nitroreductase family protein [Methanosphaera sp.]|nr:nitroreductase family protein [Methanosphaera sp.]
MSENNVLETIFNRRSVREFTDRKVSREDLMLIVRAGMSAPSAINLQPWEFIVFDEEDILDFMVDLHEYSGMFKTATAGILVCGNMDRCVENFSELWVQDCSASTENMLLAIESLSLGGVWLGIYPLRERCEKLIKYFNLPGNIVPFGIIALGYPGGDSLAKDKWDENKLHWNKW